jgi:hypothetical protein
MSEGVEIVRRPPNVSAKQVQEWAVWAHDVQLEIKAAIAHGKAAYWTLAEALYRFEEANTERDLQTGEVLVRGRGWKVLMGKDSTLNDWLAQVDIGLTSTTYWRAIAAWKELAIYRQVSMDRLVALVPGKVDIVLPSVKAGSVSTIDALDDTEAMGFDDLRTKYYGERRKVREDQADPDATDDGVANSQHQIRAQPSDVQDDELGAGNLPINGQVLSGHLSGDDDAVEERVTELVARKIESGDEDQLTPAQQQVVSALLSRSKGLDASETSISTSSSAADLGTCLALMQGAVEVWNQVSQSRIPNDLNKALAMMGEYLAEVV